MTERTIRVVQNCTADEAAAMVAAIRAYEERLPGGRPPPMPAGASVARRGAGPPGDARSGGASVLWTRPGRSKGRSF